MLTPGATTPLAANWAPVLENPATLLLASVAPTGMTPLQFAGALMVELALPAEATMTTPVDPATAALMAFWIAVGQLVFSSPKLMLRTTRPMAGWLLMVLA